MSLSQKLDIILYKINSSIPLTYISQVEAGERDMYHIIVQDNEGKLDVRVKKVPLQQDVNPLPEIIETIKIQPRYKLSLQERLESWILQKRKCNASNASDKVLIFLILYINNL